MNSGTPDEATPSGIRTFLKDMLSDRYLVNLPPVIWKPILNLFVLPSRPHRTVDMYRRFWTEQGSPYLIDSCRLADLVTSRLAARGIDGVAVTAMRYGNPSVQSALKRLESEGVDRLVVLPLFPQYSKVTVKTCVEHARKHILQSPWRVGDTVFVEDYHDLPSYIDAVVATIKEATGRNAIAEARRGGRRGTSRLLFSFHSIPVKTLSQGDPYRDRVVDTCKLIADKLGIPGDSWSIGWSSRFDKRSWLQPSPESVLSKWASLGVDDVLAVCPGFAIDCIESKIEIEQDCGRMFIEGYESSFADHLGEGTSGDRGDGGGQPFRVRHPDFRYVEALGATPRHAEVLVDAVIRAMEGRQ